MGKIKVGITGTGSLIGQAVIKSIKHSALRSRIFTVGFDYFPGTVGSYWVDKNYVIPDFLKRDVGDKKWLDAISSRISRERIRILFIGIDFELPLFSKYKAFIEKKCNCRVIVSDPGVIRIADDKYETYLFLKENGFYYPETFLPANVKNDSMVFPCIVKPRRGSRSRDVFVARSSKELKDTLKRVKNPLVQELIGNPDEEYTCGAVCFNGKLKELIVLRRTLKDGNTITAFCSKGTPRIIPDYVGKVAEKLSPFGPCNFQLRMDIKGVPKIFEINARHSGTTYIRSLFGFNEVEYILCVLLGIKLRKFNLKEGIVKRYFDEILISKE